MTYRRRARKGDAHSQDSALSALRWHAWCGTRGKRSYAGRKHAKAAIRRLPGSGMNEYECPTTPYWHIGHLPAVVRRGEVTRAEHYAKTITEEQP